MKKYIVHSFKKRYELSSFELALRKMQALNMIGSAYSFQVEEV